MSKRKKNSITKKTIHPLNDLINIRNNRPSIGSSFVAFSEKMASSRYLKWLMITLLPVLILLMYPTDGKDYDLWWQMALGKYYLTHHTLIVDHSIFSWTPADPGWIYNTCLGSIFVYLAYSLMGGFGLWVFQWLVFLGIFLSFHLFFRLLHQQLDVTSVTLIAAIGIVCSATCNFFKPELFSLLLFCWTLFIFFYVKLTRRKSLFYLYPLIFALWVNLHGAFVVGLVFLALSFIGELLNRFFFPQESFTIKDLTHFAAACVLSLVATLLNPYGIDYLLCLYNGQAVNSHDIVSQYVIAYNSLWPYLKDINVFFSRMSQGVWIMFLMMFFLGCLFLYELIKKKSCDLALLIVNAFLYWKGMQTARASYFFPLAFFFSFFYLLHRLKLKSIPGRAIILSLLILGFFFVNITYITFIYRTDTKLFGAGLDSFVPVKEVALLKKSRLEGPIFNDYTIGGYLIWELYPDYKVFIDSRGNGPFGKHVFPDYIDFANKPVTSEAIQRFREKYPFKIAIIQIHYRELPLILAFLKTGDEWRLLYFEQNAAILIHKSLLPAISPEFRTANLDLSPQRFRDVKNPDVLLNVFNLYVNLNPMAARVIYDIYKNNVSAYYELKEESLQRMDSQIQLSEIYIKP